MVFVRMPGRNGRVKKLSGRFGGPDLECGGHGRDFSEFNLRVVLRDRRLGRMNLVSGFAPEPTNGHQVHKPPVMTQASCSQDRIVVFFDDNTSDCIHLI